MSTLYEITGQYLELYEMMESADELEMKVIEDTLDGMDGELEEKAENYAIIMAELDAEAAKFEKEADACGARGAVTRTERDAERQAKESNGTLRPEEV